MINIIWFCMILSGVIMSAWKGNPQVVTDAAFQAAHAAVKYALELIGIMSFWLGVMKVAQEAGLISTLARLIKPLTGKLFPSIPSDHPALGAIILNISANILGLGNAATPFGLKAMQELQFLNRHSDKASDAMCTFLAINTSCITVMPTTIIGIRLTAGSQNPTEIVGTTVFATAISMTVAIIADRILRRFFR